MGPTTCDKHEATHAQAPPPVPVPASRSFLTEPVASSSDIASPQSTASPVAPSRDEASGNSLDAWEAVKHTRKHGSYDVAAMQREERRSVELKPTQRSRKRTRTNTNGTSSSRSSQASENFPRSRSSSSVPSINQSVYIPAPVVASVGPVTSPLEIQGAGDEIADDDGHDWLLPSLEDDADAHEQPAAADAPLDDEDDFLAAELEETRDDGNDSGSDSDSMYASY